MFVYLVDKPRVGPRCGFEAGPGYRVRRLQIRVEVVIEIGRRNAGHDPEKPAQVTSVHNRIRTKAADAQGKNRFARYMIRCPFACNKMSCNRKSGTVIDDMAFFVLRPLLNITPAANDHAPFWRAYLLPAG